MSRAAQLPGLPVLRTDDPRLNEWAKKVAEHLETRLGARGDPLERAVTFRDLTEGANLNLRYGNRSGAFGPGQVAIPIGNGFYAGLEIQAFLDALVASAFFKSFIKRLDDPTRFDDLPDKIRAILLNDIAAEAAQRGADIRTLESKIQTETESLAFRVSEITAALGNASAGIRELSFASATATRAQAGKVTQIQATLARFDPTIYATLTALQTAVPVGKLNTIYRVTNGAGYTNYKWNGTAYVIDTSTATLEQRMTATADALTGLEAQYTLKVQAGGAIAGIGLAATSDNAGNATSALLFQADKVAFVNPNYTGSLTNPDPTLVPFGIDNTGGTPTLYLNGNVRINAGGPTLAAAAEGSTSTNTVVIFAYKRSAAAPTDNPGAFTYTFSSNTTNPATFGNGWTRSIPAGTDPLYVVAVTASSTTDTDTIAANEWSSPVLLVQNGTNGLNSATVELFQRTTTNTAPAVATTGSATYTFATGGITGQPAGWTTAVPTAGGGYLWVIRATAAATTPTDTIANTEWSAPALVAQDGVNGVSAKTLTVSADGFIFSANAANTITTPASIKLTAYRQNATGTVTWTTSPTVTLYTAATGGTTTTTGDVVYLRSADFGANTSVLVTATLTDGTTFTDTCTIVRVRAGDNSPVTVLNNPTHFIPTNSAGTPVDASPYPNSGTTIQVYTDGTARTITAVTPSATNITSGAVSGLNTTTATVAPHSTITSDTARIEYTITYTKPDGTSGFAFAAQGVSKSKQGTAGATAPLVDVSSSSLFFFTPKNGGTITPTSVTLTATPQNVTTPTYVWKVDGVTQAGQTASTFSLASFAPPATKLVRVEVTGTVNGVSTTVFDQITIYSIREGDDALFAGLENENRTITCDAAGTPVAGQLPQTSKMVVVRGTTQLASPAVSFSPVSATGCTVSINSTTGVITISAISADTAEAVFRATVGGSTTLDKKLTLNKSRNGSNGSNGARGNITGYVQSATNAYSTSTTLATFSAEATAKIASEATARGATPTTPLAGDEVYFSNANGNFAYLLIYNGTAWAPPGVVIDGNLLVTGSVTAAKINSNGLSIRDTAGNVILSAGTSLAASSLAIPGTVSGVPAGWLNSNVSIASNGSLSGGGGGQVTIGGLGYTGDLAATKNQVFRQTTAPTTGMSVNDLWFNTSNNSTYYYNGTAWTLAGDRTAANTAAAIAGQGAFATLNQINTGNISTYIAAGAIGNAYIGNFIQSTNFNGTIDANGNITADGTVGWAIGKGGKAVFNTVTVRGNINTTGTGYFAGTTTGSGANASVIGIPTIAAPTTTTTHGVWGITNGVGSYGVYGLYNGTASSGVGVFGNGPTALWGNGTPATIGGAATGLYARGEGSGQGAQIIRTGTNASSVFIATPTNSLEVFDLPAKFATQIQSTVATGTAPLSVASTTLTNNLNVQNWGNWRNDAVTAANSGTAFPFAGSPSGKTVTGLAWMRITSIDGTSIIGYMPVFLASN